MYSILDLIIDILRLELSIILAISGSTSLALNEIFNIFKGDVFELIGHILNIIAFIVAMIVISKSVNTLSVFSYILSAAAVIFSTITICKKIRV